MYWFSNFPAHFFVIFFISMKMPPFWMLSQGHSIGNKQVGSLSSTTCPPIFMQLTGQNNGGIASSAFLLARKCNWLARTCIMNMRNATCVGTQTSKVPTQVTLLFIPYTVSGGACLKALAEHVQLTILKSPPEKSGYSKITACWGEFHFFIVSTLSKLLFWSEVTKYIY